MIRGLYSLLMSGAQPLLRRKLRRRGREEPGYLEAVEERFGRYRVRAEPGALWIHAVSLGETRAAGILVDALRRLDPSLRLLVTHGTATGRAEGQALLREGDTQAWLPWDTPEAVARFLDHFRPRVGVLMETEVWPNLALACAERGLPLALANARLSDKSLRQAQRLAWLSRPAYASLAAVWAQSEADAQRLREAGARVSGVLGNLKFDAEPDAQRLAQGRAWRAATGAPVVMFASSREGEEREFLRVLRAQLDMARSGRGRRNTDRLLAERPVQWLIVPRHPQRFEEVAGIARAHGFSVSCRSQWTDEGPAAAEVWVGDTLGDMALYYGLADVALLGGSFAPLGGQNLIEAAACGCPVVMGPHTFNFAEAATAAEGQGAALRANSIEDALRHALVLVADEAGRRCMVEQAGQFAQAHRGAALRCAQALLALGPPDG
ncbi:3-deoxy-D-manno-octulosonic acid transferase [Ramlibacter rhizophilus]|uniref:3-deoxy-D-manno-octulosonic acid transferase n=1 Tax=Ramlibacter rhizophilus TaxID=1781167 RepID=A0A4Z0BBM8_9BURK|nr:3-deoxy-D-manno-octulosonic acid transferase [Ramlibacter rhizophilus]TFY96565.1 3-deoxy-D-manno-octulosonic acid transferase [Ramlibacter rhizophilus]